MRSLALVLLFLASLALASPARAQSAEYGAATMLNIGAGTTQVVVGKSRLGCVSVIASPSTATTISDIASGSPGNSTAVVVIAASAPAGTIVCPNWPLFNGLSITVGTAGVVALSYGIQ